MRTKVISKEQRAEKWVGRKVLIRGGYPKPKSTGFFDGTVHEVVKPPKGYLNSQMQVFLLSKKGEVVSVNFPYWTLLPAGYVKQS